MAPRTTTRSTGTRKGATATKPRSRAKDVAAEADEYVEVKGGGDFPETWDFEERGSLKGTFLGSEVKEIKGKDRTIHSVEVHDSESDLDGEQVNVWGAAILDSRLNDLEPGVDIKITKTGEKIKTKSGHHAAEYVVGVKRGALRSPR